MDYGRNTLGVTFNENISASEVNQINSIPAEEITGKVVHYQFSILYEYSFDVILTSNTINSICLT